MRIEYAKNSKTLIADDGKVLININEPDLQLYAVTTGLDEPNDNWTEQEVEEANNENSSY